MEAARAMIAMVNCMLMVGGMRCRIATKGLLIKCGIMWQVRVRCSSKRMWGINKEYGMYSDDGWMR